MSRSKPIPKLPNTYRRRCNNSNSSRATSNNLFSYCRYNSSIHNICSLDSATINSSKVRYRKSKRNNFKNSSYSNIFIRTIPSTKQCYSNNSRSTSRYMVRSSICRKFNSRSSRDNDVPMIRATNRRYKYRSASPS